MVPPEPWTGQRHEVGSLTLACPVSLSFWVWALPLVNAKKCWAAMDTVLEIIDVLWMFSGFLSERYNPLKKEFVCFAKLSTQYFPFLQFQVPFTSHCQMGELPSAFKRLASESYRNQYFLSPPILLKIVYIASQAGLVELAQNVRGTWVTLRPKPFWQADHCFLAFRGYLKKMWMARATLHLPEHFQKELRTSGLNCLLPRKPWDPSRWD